MYFDKLKSMLKRGAISARFVTPAKAGVLLGWREIPAYAGMTDFVTPAKAGVF